MDRSDLSATVERVAVDTTFCAEHTNQATVLRCNRCATLICTKCAQRTAVGYTCRNCVRGHQAVFETVLWRDYIVTGLIALMASSMAGAVLASLGWLVIFLAPIAGGVIAEIIQRAVSRRRGRYLSYVAVTAMVLAALPNLLSSNLWSLMYLVLAARTVYTRLSGTSI